MLPVSRPSIGQEELEEIKKVFATGWLGLGSLVFEFESKIKEYLGAKNVIAVSTGTAALHLALDGFGIGEGDEVVVPSLTFCATIQAITALQAIPVFCEVEPETLNIDVDDARKRITNKTKAIIPVHYCGNVCDMSALLDLGYKHGIIIVEDAAHAFGSSYEDKKTGSFGDATCFSFDPIKMMTCGEGGAIVLSNDEVAEQIRQKRILGIDKDTWHRYRNQRSWFYEVVTQGYRYHMSNINAAIGLAQFRKLDKFIKKKKYIVKIYNENLSSIKGLELINWNLDQTAPFTYIAKVVNGERDGLIEFLKVREIGSGVHYIANHTQPFFSKYASALPVTEKVVEEIITLPLYYDMTDNDVSKVVDSVKEFFENK